MTHSSPPNTHLDLPRELDLIRDVEVDLEVEQVTHALVVERVQAFNHQDLCNQGVQVGVSREALESIFEAACFFQQFVLHAFQLSM